MRSHINAILAVGDDLAFDMADSGKPEGNAQRYAFLGAANLRETQGDLSDQRRDVDDLIHITAAGVSARQVREMQDEITAAYDGAKPDVDGYDCHLERLYGSPVSRGGDITFTDTNTGPFYGVDTYRYTATLVV
jgi:hypothetical protein